MCPHALPGRPVLFMVLTLFGCSKGDGYGEPPIPDVPSDTAPEISCGGVNPEILTFGAEAVGLWGGEEGAEQLPTVELQLMVIDEDKDLSEVRLELWFDDWVDGVVDTGDRAWLDRYITISSERCLTSSANLIVHAGAKSGTDLEPNTWYDWAARVSDDAGLQSDIATTVAGTPKEDGTDPDPRI